MEEGPQEKIGLSQALAQSKYPKENYELLINFLEENYMKNENIKIYLMKSGEKIFIIKYCLTIAVNNDYQKLYILLYLPEKFPNYHPEFYILSETKNLEISEYYPNYKINHKTLLIDHETFCNFDSHKMNIEQIISCMISDFSDHFPFKIAPFKFDMNSGKCCLDMRNLIEVSLLEKDKIERNLREKLKIKVINLYNNTFNEIKESIEELKNTEKEMNKKQNEIKIIVNQYENQKKLLVDLENVRNKMTNVANNIVLNCKNFGKNYKYEEDFRIDKCKDVVHIKDENIFKYDVMIKTLEDFLIYLKKGVKENKISFEVGKNETRELSRELFTLMYLKNNKKI